MGIQLLPLIKQIFSEKPKTSYEVQNWCIHYKHFMTDSESGQTEDLQGFESRWK